MYNNINSTQTAMDLYRRYFFFLSKRKFGQWRGLTERVDRWSVTPCRRISRLKHTAALYFASETVGNFLSKIYRRLRVGEYTVLKYRV